MGKPKIAFYWCSSCGGCEESVLDLAQDILPVIEAMDIVFWPVALDFKYADLDALADGEIAVSLINGAIRMDEHERIAKVLRKKSQLVIAHGACAHLGGVVGLANFYENKSILDRAYKEVPSLKNPQGTMPQVKTFDGNNNKELELPCFCDSVKPLNQVIEVDYYLPGCPPTPKLIKNALTAVLEGKLPVKGSVLAEKKSLCDSCSRRDSKPDKAKITEFKRIHEIECDPGKCFLSQAVICLGPATRGGCEERCIKANMPCRGCFGPLENVVDQGAKSLSFLASLIDSNDENEIKNIIDAIADPAGLFYRYSLASATLKEKIKKRN